MRFRFTHSTRITIRSLRARFTLVAALGGALLLLGAVSASANPSIDEKQAQAQAIIEEIQRIDEEVGAAAERWNGANIELQQLTDELSATRRYLAVARASYRVAQERVAGLLRELYVTGERTSGIEAILGAESIDEALDSLSAAQRVADQDARIARQATEIRARIAKREDRLTEARARQGDVVEHLAADKRAIEARLAERERLLGSVREEIARLQEEERRRQEELRRRAQLELERQQRLAAEQREREQAAARAAEQAAAEPLPAAPSFLSEDPVEEPIGEQVGDGDGLTEPAPSVEYTPPPADASRGSQVVAISMQFLGIPYRWGGSSPSTGFDCSGFTSYVFAQIGVSLPHHAATQFTLGSPVSRDQLEPGDLVFFRGLGHMGMYIGGGNFIHSPHTGDVVKITSLSESYYVRNWVGAKRVL